MFLMDGVADRAVQLVDEYYLHHAWLLQNAQAQGRLLYNVVVKTHMLYHIADLSRLLRC